MSSLYSTEITVIDIDKMEVSGDFNIECTSEAMAIADGKLFTAHWSGGKKKRHGPWVRRGTTSVTVGLRRAWRPGPRREGGRGCRPPPASTGPCSPPGLRPAPAAWSAWPAHSIWPGTCCGSGGLSGPPGSAARRSKRCVPRPAVRCGTRDAGNRLSPLSGFRVYRWAGVGLGSNACAIRARLVEMVHRLRDHLVVGDGHLVAVCRPTWSGRFRA